MFLGSLLSLIGFVILGLQFLLWKQLSFDQLRFSALGCAVLLYQLWGKRRSLTLKSDPASTVLGLGLIALFVVKATGSPGGIFASFAPALWGSGLALVASGFSGLKQYRRELLILVFLTVPFFIRWLVFDAVGLDLSPATAKVGTLMVRALGYHATVAGDVVTVPAGSVNVYQACSGLKAMFFLFGLAILFVVIFPPRGRLQALATPLVALATGFLVNAFRVALLILFVATANKSAFHYWHTEDGAQMFEVASVVLFILLYRFVFLREPSRTPAGGNS